MLFRREEEILQIRVIESVDGKVDLCVQFGSGRYVRYDDVQLGLFQISGNTRRKDGKITFEMTRSPYKYNTCERIEESKI